MSELIKMSKEEFVKNLGFALFKNTNVTPKEEEIIKKAMSEADYLVVHKQP